VEFKRFNRYRAKPKGNLMYKLFDDQIKTVNETVTHLRAGKNVLLCAPVGAGKTINAAEIMRQMNLPTIFLVNKQILVSQSYDKFFNHGLNAAIIHNTITKNVDGEVMNDNWHEADIIVSLVETLENANIDFEPALLVLDETHKATSEAFQNFRNKFPNITVLGLTATPGRFQNKEGEALSDWYDVMVMSTPITELIELGRLAVPQYRYYSEDSHVVKAWLEATKNDSNKRTLVFTQDARHSLAIKASFEEFGIKAEIVTAGTELEDVKDLLSPQTPGQRNEIFRQFRSGETPVLISFGVLCEGFDEPLAKYCLLLRQPSYVALLHQMIGRVLRAHETKMTGVIMDFAGNIDKYGPIEKYVWEMDGTGRKTVLAVENGQSIYFGNYARREKLFMKCECSHVYDFNDRKTCPQCKKRNTVNVSADFEQLNDMVVKTTGFDKLKAKLTNTKKGQEVFSLMAIIKRAIETKKGMLFNRVWFEIFQDDVNLLEDFAWMNSIKDLKKLGSRDRVEFAL
jgi:superfamily II DNA or RNA helicase